MKIQYTILCWLIGCLPAYCQIVWQQHFNDVQTDIISMFHLNSDNSIRMVGIQDDEPLSYSFNAEKSINKASIFSDKLPFTPNIIYGIDAQNYIITHQHDKGLTYAQVDTKGTIAWKKEFTTVAKISTICVTQSKDILMVGTQKGQMFAACLDANGETLWEQSFGGSGQIYDVVEDKKGNFILVGFVDLFQSGETDYFITKLNAKGKNVWEKVLGDPEFLNEKARLVAITPQEQILIIGHRNDNIWMMQIAPQNQSVTWETEIKETGFVLEPTQLFMLDDGNVFIANTAQKGEKSNLFMIQANTELMASANEWSAQFTLEAMDGFNQRRLSVRFKETGKYYRVSSSMQNVDEVELYGKYPKGQFVYVLGLNRQGMMGVVFEPTTKGETAKMITKVDVNMYQFLIVLVSNSPCNIQDIRSQLAKEKRVIAALPQVLGKRLIPFDNIQYRNDELGAVTRMSSQNVVSFFVQLK
jgi:outer membrane protein assembly factor BamB